MREFELTHRPEWLEILHGLHVHAALFASGAGVAAVRAFAPHGPSPATR